MCSTVHRPVALAPGERATCVACNAVLAKGTHFGPDTALAFALTGAVLTVPAFTLPFITVSKLANDRVGVLLTGAGALWTDGLRLTSAWVLVCGAIAPVLLLGVLIAALAPARLGWRDSAPRRIAAVAHAIEHWSMPEVHVLAVLVALVKLHSLVGVEIGWGFWSYIAMSLLTLLAWRSFEIPTTVLKSEPASA